eukprot:TRINITY_DN9007_c0_g1_i1.p1 TRINITY_DN9007_c0_g1~~TRINITY_DN9007_c0_g1_i1.p1  ORF type:complete len:352 (+),score=156.70 TRINITY_DN9007_c0_g1_i1:63-1118(+)
MPRFGSVLELVGKTPVVKINRMAPKHVNMYVKVEAMNPLGSVKDRLALGIIEDAERRGVLKPGMTVVEATSGNTGIGLAMVCAAKGYPLVVTMAEQFSVERRKILRYLGAQVVLTPAPLKGFGMVKKAEELAKEHGWFLTRQFSNEANANYHSETTAQEIIADFSDVPLDYWVSGYGTGGTVRGVSRVLREKSPNTKIIVTEPETAPLLTSEVPTKYDEHGDPAEPHSKFSPHPMQGWTPDFVSSLLEGARKDGHIDEVTLVSGPEAIKCATDLGQQEGIFVGISGGGTYAAALKTAETAKEGSNILCMLPDTAERYLSTPLFEKIPAEMNEAEYTLSHSTPIAQYPAASA